MQFHPDGLYRHIQPTLHHLRECDGSPYDWTSAATTFEPADHIRQAAARYFGQSELLHRSPANGEPLLIAAVVEYFRRCGIPCAPDNVFIASSTFQIVSDMYDLSRPTGKVLIPAPSFGRFVEQCAQRYLPTVKLDTHPADGWKVTPDALDQALTRHRPSIFLFTNPVNPTGAVYTRAEVEELAAVLRTRDTLTIADEVFRDVLLDPARTPHSLAAVPGMADRVVTLNGVGKSRGLPSMFVSFCAAPADLVSALRSENTVGQQRLQQLVAAAALADTPENRTYLETTAARYRANGQLIRDWADRTSADLASRFGHEPPVVCPVVPAPEATNVYLLNFFGLRGMVAADGTLATGLDVARYLRREAGVGTVPAEGFLMDPSLMSIRLTIARPPEELAAGLDAFARACQKLISPPRLQPPPSSGTTAQQR